MSKDFDSLATLMLVNIGYGEVNLNDEVLTGSVVR